MTLPPLVTNIQGSFRIAVIHVRHDLIDLPRRLGGVGTFAAIRGISRVSEEMKMKPKMKLAPTSLRFLHQHLIARKERTGGTRELRCVSKPASSANGRSIAEITCG